MSTNSIVGQNKILSLSSTSSSASITGIKVSEILARVCNNVVRLGCKANGNPLTAGYAITGIADSASSSSYHFNTILIEGNGVTGSSNTHALRDFGGDSPKTANILLNLRSNDAGGTGRHCAISSYGDTRCDRNNLYAPGNGGCTGLYNGTPEATLADWRSASGQDANSISHEILFAGNTLAPDDGYFVPGDHIEGITADINGKLRDPVGDQGAYEGQEHHWTGKMDEDWDNPANWDHNTLPGANDNVILRTWPDTPSRWPSVDTDPMTPAICKNLHINTGTQLTVLPGKALTVSQQLKNKSEDFACLVIKSSNEGTGSLIFTGGAPKAGVQRYIQPWTDNDHGWHFLSSPVENQAIRPEFVPQPVPGGDQDFYSWSEPLDLWINTRDSLGNWNTGFEDQFTIGKGYLVAYRQYVTLDFRGVLNNSDLPIPGLTRTEATSHTGWNLLGNPFPSAITWNTPEWIPDQVGGVAKIWNEANASYSDIFEGEVIPALQGFMVEAFANGASLTIPVKSCTHSATPWYKSTGDPFIKLTAINAADNTAQESIIRLCPGATSGFDADLDGHFLPGYGPKFYSVSGNDILSTNALPLAGTPESIPFRFSMDEDGFCTIRLTEIRNMPFPVYLADLKTGHTQCLSANPEYSFTSETTDDPGRFLVSFAPVGLPESTKESIPVFACGNTLVIRGKGAATLEIFDLSGRRVLSEEISLQGNTRKDLHLSSGIYLVRITGNEYTGVTRVRITGSV